MREVWIRRRADGVTELTPTVAPLDASERWLVIFTVVMATAGFFMAGVMPFEVLAALVAACLAGGAVPGANAPVEFRQLFIHRLGALAGVPIIALMCYYTIVVLVIFRPFTKTIAQR